MSPEVLEGFFESFMDIFRHLIGTPPLRKNTTYTGLPHYSKGWHIHALSWVQNHGLNIGEAKTHASVETKIMNDSFRFNAFENINTSVSVNIMNFLYSEKTSEKLSETATP